MFTPNPRVRSSPTRAAADDGLGAAQRMRPKEAWVPPDAGDPKGETSAAYWPRRYRSISTVTAVDEDFAPAFTGSCDIIFDCLSGHGNPSLIAGLRMKLQSLNERAASNLSSRHV